MNEVIMNTPALGRLEKVELRTAWTSEWNDFTPWLAKPENLKLLGETVGIDLEFEAQEKEVGPFRADILCKDTLDSSWVLIENQLEKTDHTHLGQLLTYASGLETVTIIWIAQHFTEEHRATLDWLNEITNERFAFFGLEIELWRIGTSPVAPKFNIVSKPNDWSKSVRSSAAKATELSDVKRTQLEFWTAFQDYMEEHSNIRCQKPAPQPWMNHSIGRSGFGLTSIASTWNSETQTSDPQLRVEFYISVPEAHKYFEILASKKSDIETEIGQPLIWSNPPAKQTCKAYVRRSANFLDSSQWPQQQEWLRENLEKFHRVFAPRIKQLDALKAPANHSESPTGGLGTVLLE
jgi:hypothetical protein